MRTIFAVIFVAIIIALGICTVVAKRSKKAIAGSVAFLDAAFIMPVLGNLIIIVTAEKLFQGYYFSKPIPVEEFEKQYLT